MINVNDSVYLITYNTVSTGSLLGQGQASIAIANSSFTLTNPFDTTKPKFIFDDMNIYDAGSVVGQFTAYLAPTFFIGSATYTLNTVNLAVTDNNDHPYPLLPNPTMFSINGFNYVIDSNRVPHAIVGNNNVSPISTDVTVQSGHPIPNSTFTLNGLIYTYTEDALENLLTITGTKSYMIAQPGLTFKLDSSLVLHPQYDSARGGDLPLHRADRDRYGRNHCVNLYAGTSESGGADFFMYKNVLYTLVKSERGLRCGAESLHRYAAKPAPTQQQLAVFNLGGHHLSGHGRHHPRRRRHRGGHQPGHDVGQDVDRQSRNPVWPRLWFCRAADQRYRVGNRCLPIPGHGRQWQHHAVRHPLYSRQQCQHGEG